jgi:hypothetical protein
MLAVPQNKWKESRPGIILEQTLILSPKSSGTTLSEKHSKYMPLRFQRKEKKDNSRSDRRRRREIEINNKKIKK